MPRPSTLVALPASPARRDPPARPTLTALCLSLATLGLAAMVAPAQAAPPKTYVDPKGWYSLEVPEGFKPKNVTETSALFESRDGNGWFTLAVIPGASSLDVGMTISVTTFGKVMPNAAADGEPLSLDVGGSPARWVVYRGNIVAAGQSVPMVGLGGALALPGCTLTLTTAMANDSHAKYGDVVLTAFRSLRGGTRGSVAGAPSAADGTAKPAPAAAPAPVKGKPVPYEDPDARFAIDLPPGFSKVSTDGALAKFEGEGGGWFNLAFLAGVSDLDAAAGVAGKTFQNLLPAGVSETPQNLDVNGRPARWMVRRGDMKLTGTTVKAVGLGGAVTLPAGSVALVTVLTADSHAKWGEAIAASFKSLRAGTGAAAGTARKEAFGATSTLNADGTTTFAHPAGSFDLPAGWTVGKPEGDLAFAQFNNRNGAALTFHIGPRGYRSNKAMCEASEALVHRALPQMQIQPPGHHEVDSQRNNKVSLARYQGPVTLEGRELDGRGFTAWGKAARGLIVGFGVAMGPTAQSDIDEMEKIARTLR